MAFRKNKQIALATPPPQAKPVPTNSFGAMAGLGNVDDSAVWVTRQMALSVPALHRGVDLIASTIGSFPLRAFKDRQNLDGSEIGNFLAQPEPHVPASVTISQTVRDLIFDGCSFWVIQSRYASGVPASVRRFAPSEVTSNVGATVLVAGAPVPLSNVICFYGPDTDWSASNGPVATGLLTTAARTITTAIRLEESAARYAWNEIPYGVLSTADGVDLDDPEILELLSQWETARRRRATAYLPASVNWESVKGPDPDKLQLNEARQYIALEISRHLNLPARYVSATTGDSLTYFSASADRRDLVDLGLRPWLSAIESRLSMVGAKTDKRIVDPVTPQGVLVQFDLTEFINSDPAARAGVINSYIASGVSDVDEARAWLNLPARIPRSEKGNNDNSNV